MQESNQCLKEICMSKTKIVEKIVRFELFLTVIGQLCKSDQKENITKQDFSRIEFLETHTVTNCLIFTKLRNCAKL